MSKIPSGFPRHSACGFDPEYDLRNIAKFSLTFPAGGSLAQEVTAEGPGCI